MKIKKLSHHRYCSDVDENEIREDGALIKEGVEKLVKIF